MSELNHQIPAGAAVLRQSYEQEWYSYNYLLYPSRVHRLWFGYDVEGSLDVAALRRAVATMISRNPGMRTVFFIDGDGIPLQRVLADKGTDVIRCQRILSSSRKQFEAYVRAALQSDAQTPWKLSEEPPYRLRLLQYSSTRFTFLATLHHIAFDFTAMEALERSLWDFYAHEVYGVELDDPQDALASTVSKLHQRYDGRANGSNAEYWARQYAIAPPVWQQVGIADRTTHSQSLSDRAMVSAEYGAETTERIRMVCRGLGCSLFELAVCAFSWCAFLVSPQDRLATYVVFDSRGPGDEGLVGMLEGFHPLVLRRPGDSPKDFLDHVRQEIIRAMAHRHVTGEKRLEAVMRQWSRWHIAPQRALSLTYLKARSRRGGDEDARDGIRKSRLAWREFAPIVARGDDSLHMILRESERKIEIYLQYNPDALTRSFVGDILEVVKQMLTTNAVGEGISVSPLPDQLVGRNRSLAPDGLLPLRDRDGLICLMVNCEEVAVILRHHEAVESADVSIADHPDGGTEVVASVRTSGHVTDEELCEFCRDWPGGSVYAIPPRRIIRLTADGDSGSRRIQADEPVYADVLSLMMELMPGAGADSEFWAAGGSFSLLRQLSREARLRGLPDFRSEEFGVPRTLSSVARAISRRADEGVTGA